MQKTLLKLLFDIKCLSSDFIIGTNVLYQTHLLSYFSRWEFTLISKETIFGKNTFTHYFYKFNYQWNLCRMLLWNQICEYLSTEILTLIQNLSECEDFSFNQISCWQTLRTHTKLLLRSSSLFIFKIQAFPWKHNIDQTWRKFIILEKFIILSSFCIIETRNVILN